MLDVATIYPHRCAYPAGRDSPKPRSSDGVQYFLHYGQPGRGCSNEALQHCSCHPVRVCFTFVRLVDVFPFPSRFTLLCGSERNLDSNYQTSLPRLMYLPNNTRIAPVPSIAPVHLPCGVLSQAIELVGPLPILKVPGCFVRSRLTNFTSGVQTHLTQRVSQWSEAIKD